MTFVHVACSGAAVGEQDPSDPGRFKGGILDPYAGLKPPAGAAPLPPQIDQVRTILGNRAIDALLIQIGADDLVFGDIVTKCMIQASCHVDANPAALDPTMGTIVGAGVLACGGLPAAPAAACRTFLTSLSTTFSGQSASMLLAGQPHLPTPHPVRHPERAVADPAGRRGAWRCGQPRVRQPVLRSDPWQRRPHM